jgi:hypothetical protein
MEICQRLGFSELLHSLCEALDKKVLFCFVFFTEGERRNNDKNFWTGGVTLTTTKKQEK